MQISVTGFGWYCHEDYDQLKALFEDGPKLPDTYEAWLNSAQTMFDTLTKQGHKVVKAPIDLATFPEWCRVRGLKLNAQARMAYSNDFAAKTFQK